MYGKADVSLEQFMGLASSFGDISVTTFFDFDIFVELKPKELPKFSNIVRPLDQWTWTCLLIALATVSLVIYVVQLVDNENCDNNLVGSDPIIGFSQNSLN